MDVNKILDEINKEIVQYVDKKSSVYKIDGVQYIGTRKKQEDTIVYFQNYENLFACLADGIGGLEYGEIASAIACRELLGKCLKALSGDGGFLVNGFQDADRKVNAFIDNNNLRGSGCTLIGVWIDKHRLFFCSIGDSLLYLYRNGELKQLNRRHNYKLYLDDLLLSNKISNSDYQANLNKKDIVISYIGKGNISLIDFNKEGMLLEHGDVILICSDGVFNALDEADIKNIIDRNKNPATINSSIINLLRMKKKPKQDNTSIISIYKEGNK